MLVPWQNATGLAVAVAEALAFAATVPLMPANATPRIARLCLGVAVIPILSHVLPRITGEPIAEMLRGAIAGASFGLSAAVVASAVNAAGDLIDVALGSPPFAERASNGGPIVRVYQLAYASILVGSGGLTKLIAEFARASSALQEPRTTMHALAAIASASFQTSLLIAGPSLFAQALAALVSGILSRVAPQLGSVLLSAPLVSGSVLLAVTIGALVLRQELVDVVRQIVAGPAGLAP
jgi:flagellar biosynthesis protein FliR